MRPTLLETSDYAFYSQDPTAAYFKLIAAPDTHACIYCPMHARNSMYYPPLHLREYVSEGTPLKRVRVCQNHYSNLRNLILRDSGMPKDFDYWYKVLVERNLAQEVNKKPVPLPLPGWRGSEDGTRMYNNMNSAETQYFELFQTWVKGEGIMFKSAEARITEFQWFLNEYPEMDLATQRAFETYLNS